MRGEGQRSGETANTNGVCQRSIWCSLSQRWFRHFHFWHQRWKQTKIRLIGATFNGPYLRDETLLWFFFHCVQPRFTDDRAEAGRTGSERLSYYFSVSIKEQQGSNKNISGYHDMFLDFLYFSWMYQTESTQQLFTGNKKFFSSRAQTWKSFTQSRNGNNTQYKAIKVRLKTEKPPFSPFLLMMWRWPLRTKSSDAAW